MDKKPILHLNTISLLITHYNRSESLSILLQRLEDLQIKFFEIIVSDDCSIDKHLTRLKSLQKRFNFTLLTTPKNKGLGASLNALHNHATSDYLLYIQEDFVPGKALPAALEKGHQLLHTDPQWDLVRFYAFPWAQFPYQRKFKDGFNELLFRISPLYNSHLKFFVYSDHPHLKRKDFTEKFGPYMENVKGDVTEQTMCRNFLKNNGKALFFEENQTLFEHENTEEEPAYQRNKGSLTTKLKSFKPIYWTYLQFRLIKETFSYVINA